MNKPTKTADVEDAIELLSSEALIAYARSLDRFGITDGVTGNLAIQLRII